MSRIVFHNLKKNELHHIDDESNLANIKGGIIDGCTPRPEILKSLSPNKTPSTQIQSDSSFLISG